MQSLNHAQARELFLHVFNRHFAERHSPLPGAFVKAQMLEEAQQNGNTFSERELGFRKFIDFIRTIPEVAIQELLGSDILLAPANSTTLLAAYTSPLPYLRRDFWRAFIEFPVENTVRLYDPKEDKVLHEQVGTLRQGIEVEPVSREEQLQWRVSFSAEQPEAIRKELQTALEGQRAGNAIFNEFSRRLRENPSVARAWNQYLQKQITNRVKAWASKNEVPQERWIASARGTHINAGDTKPQNLSQRAELYNLFDQLPIENLLQLRVPLEWVLKVTR